MLSGFGAILMNLLSYPVLICSVVIALTSVVLLIVKGRAMKKELKILLIVLGVIAIAVIVFFVFMVIVSGNNHPEVPPIPVG